VVLNQVFGSFTGELQFHPAKCRFGYHSVDHRLVSDHRFSWISLNDSILGNR
jgi:hypothetical protein